MVAALDELPKVVVAEVHDRGLHLLDGALVLSREETFETGELVDESDV